MLQRAVDLVGHFQTQGIPDVGIESGHVSLEYAALSAVERIEFPDQCLLMRDLGYGCPDRDLNFSELLMWHADCAQALADHCREMRPGIALIDFEREMRVREEAGLPLSVL